MGGIATPAANPGLSDWVELRLLYGPVEHLSRSELLDEIDETGTVGDLADYDRSLDGDIGAMEADGHVDELVSDADVLVDEVMAELELRNQIVGNHYPFRVEANGVRRTFDDWRERVGYAFLAALNARYLFGLPANINEGARVFERLVVPALSRYWAGRAVHFGWPRHGTDVTKFCDAMNQLVNRDLRERIIRRPEEFPQQQRDLGVDAVAWRPLDHRRGQAVLLVQCAIGDDWDEKGLHVDTWRSFISFAVAPMKALAFPFVPEVRRNLDWEVLCAKVGVPFDRLRLAHLLGDEPQDPELRERAVQWIESLAPYLVWDN